MTHEELRERMGPFNPNQSHRSRMTKQGIILAKDRKARVQKELDERIASSAKSAALKKKKGAGKMTKKEFQRRLRPPFGLQSPNPEYHG